MGEGSKFRNKGDEVAFQICEFLVPGGDSGEEPRCRAVGCGAQGWSIWGDLERAILEWTASKRPCCVESRGENSQRGEESLPGTVTSEWQARAV